jgi:Phosphoribosyltransferase
MMSAVEKLDLAAIGAMTAVPEASAYRSATTRGVRPGDPRPTGDRLTELAAWWVTVAGTAPPRRVEQLWLPRPSSVGPARAEVVIRGFDAPREISEATAWGVAMVDDAVDAGTDLLLLSVGSEEEGEHGDTSWHVLAAHLLDVDPVEAMGWPVPGEFSDADWIVQVAAIRDGLRPVRGIRDQPERLLEVLGSAALAAGTGLLLQAAARRTPTLLDGPGAAACALLAHRVARSTRSWWQATDAGGSALQDRVLAELRLDPLTRFGLKIEDGTAARIGLGLLEAAIARAIAGADGDLTEAEPDVDDMTDVT